MYHWEQANDWLSQARGATVLRQIGGEELCAEDDCADEPLFLAEPVSQTHGFPDFVYLCSAEIRARDSAQLWQLR